MNNFLNDIVTAFARRNACRRTAFELRSMNLETALDLDIFREDADIIARKTVYGQ